MRRSQLITRARELVRGVGLGRVLCWQLAAAAVIASIDEPRSITAAVCIVAIFVVAATALRFHGLWLYQWLARIGTFLLRQRHRTIQAGADSADDLVDVVAQHARVETVDLDDVPVAFIHHPAGITAVLEPHVSSGSYEDGSTSPGLNLSSAASLLPSSDVDAPPYAAQLIMQMAPASAPGGTARRRTWITLQAVRTADIHRDDDLGAALANSVRRLIRRLARDELPTRTLDREEALSLIVGLAQLGDPADGPDPVQVRETWGAWNAGLTTQACFRIDKWQEAEESARQLILHRLQMVPSLGTTVAIAARRRDRRAELQSHVVIRITEANRARLNNSADLLEFAMANTGSNVRLERLNGDQLAAVAASLPLGGQPTMR